MKPTAFVALVVVASCAIASVTGIVTRSALAQPQGIQVGPVLVGTVTDNQVGKDFTVIFRQGAFRTAPDVVTAFSTIHFDVSRVQCVVAPKDVTATQFKMSISCDRNAEVKDAVISWVATASNNRP